MAQLYLIGTDLVDCRARSYCHLDPGVGVNISPFAFAAQIGGAVNSRFGPLVQETSRPYADKFFKTINKHVCCHITK